MCLVTVTGGEQACAPCEILLVQQIFFVSVEYQGASNVVPILR